LSLKKRKVVQEMREDLAIDDRTCAPEREEKGKRKSMVQRHSLFTQLEEWEVGSEHTQRRRWRCGGGPVQRVKKSKSLIAVKVSFAEVAVQYVSRARGLRRCSGVKS
jgi:hypothetical protein